MASQAVRPDSNELLKNIPAEKHERAKLKIFLGYAAWGINNPEQGNPYAVIESFPFIIIIAILLT
jgi:hypothetical protein